MKRQRQKLVVLVTRSIDLQYTRRIWSALKELARVCPRVKSLFFSSMGSDNKPGRPTPIKIATDTFPHDQDYEGAITGVMSEPLCPVFMLRRFPFAQYLEVLNFEIYDMDAAIPDTTAFSSLTTINVEYEEFRKQLETLTRMASKWSRVPEVNVKMDTSHDTFDAMTPAQLQALSTWKSLSSVTIWHFWPRLILPSGIENICEFLRALPTTINVFKVYLLQEPRITAQDIAQSIMDTLRSSFPGRKVVCKTGVSARTVTMYPVDWRGTSEIVSHDMSSEKHRLLM